MSSSPTLASDPLTTDFVVMSHRIDRPEPGCGLQVSGDGGQSWLGVAGPRLPPGVDRCHSPMVGFDPRGNLYYLFAGQAGPDNRVVGTFLARSTDGARSFGLSVPVAGEGSLGARLAVEPGSGRIHVAWLHAGDPPSARGFTSIRNTIMSAFSDDEGVTFSDPATVAAAGSGRVAAPAIAAAAGRVTIAYYDLGGDNVDYEGLEGARWSGHWSLLAARSTDNGASFTEPEVVDDAVAPFARVPSVLTMAPPALAAGRGLACLGWADARHGDSDVLVRCRREGGRWGPASRVNQDPVGNGTWQYLPDLALADNGRLDVAFYDRRGHQSNDRAAVGYSYSYDLRQFSSNIAVSHEYHDPKVGPKGPQGASAPTTDHGSHLAVLSLPSAALIAWADTRNAGDAAAARDIYTAQASLLFTSTRPGWAPGVGVLMAAGGLGGLFILGRRRRGAG